MTGLSRIRSLVLGALLLTWSAGCTPLEYSSTKLLVRVDGGERVRALSELRITLHAADGAVAAEAGPPVELPPFLLTREVPRDGRVQLPLWFGISPGRARRLLVVVQGFRAGARTPVLEHKVFASFHEGRSVVLRIELADDCLERVCAALDQTCAADRDEGCGPVPTPSTETLVPGAEIDGVSPFGPDGALRDAGPSDAQSADGQAGKLPSGDARSADAPTGHEGHAPDGSVGPARSSDTRDASDTSGSTGVGDVPSIPPPTPVSAGAGGSGGMVAPAAPGPVVPAAPTPVAPVAECAPNSTAPACGPRCATTNMCTSPDYPCLDLTTGGYTCLGQLADWPMPDATPGGTHALSYDAVSAPGSVIDNVTKLQWQRTPPESLMGCSSDRVTNGSPRAPSYACTWAEAARYCEQLALGNHDDWRLPSAIELLSLADDSRQGPAIDPVFYRNDVEKESAWYPAWTASSSVHGEASAWAVDFSYGPASHDRRLKTDLLRVRCVRSGPLLAGATSYDPAQRYQSDAAARSVTDTRTGLVWEQPIERTKHDQRGALDHCAARGAGYRVPTRKELLTLVDFTRELPAIVSPFLDAPAAFGEGGAPNDWFWSATPWSLERPGGESLCTASTCFQTVEFADGRVGLASPTMVDGHASRGYVRCVK
jgi:hypothetical protein